MPTQNPKGDHDADDAQTEDFCGQRDLFPVGGQPADYIFEFKDNADKTTRA